MLDDYFKVEYIDFEYICHKCKNILPHRKILKLCKLPKILVFSFQRFDIQNNIKNNIKVSFPEILNVNDYIDEICGDKINSLYNLYAIITHEGNLEFGHYRSCIKINHSNQWYEFNDSIVKEISLEDSLFENAYILFYIKN